MFKSFFNKIASWGFEETKLVTLTYDEARNRITDVEYHRLVDAFKRVAISNSHINRNTFSSEVLGDLFPSSICDILFGACGGSAKGILFKDLVAALVLITKGTIEEKIRFMYLIYAGDSTSIAREAFLKFTRDEEGVQVEESVLQKLFSLNNLVEFDQFQQWILMNRQATFLSSWLVADESSPVFGSNLFKLTDEHDSPTFYQTLAGVTHLEEEDIVELEKCYWYLHSYSRNGTMDYATLQPLISPPLPLSIVQDFLDAFDENRDGHIDFKEMACGISAAARGPPLERQKFCFKIFDHDKDGLLSVSEIHNMVNVMKLVTQENLPDSPSEEVITILTKDEDILVQEILQSSSTGEHITLSEYLVWSLSNRLPEQFLTLIYQVCQIVLGGLHPLDPLEEYDVVTSWLGREEKRGFQAHQTWYLISMEWWNSWLNYASPNPPFMSNSDSGLGSIVGSIGSGSNSIASFSDSNVGATTNSANTSTKTSSSSRCWSMKRTPVESPVAMDTIQNVIVTGISPYDVESINSSTPALLSPHTKSSSSSLSLVTLDSSSNSPSPVNSPGSFRRELGGSMNGHGRSTHAKRRKPDAIDNSNLVIPPTKAPSLTSEGARLRRGVEPGRDFKVVPQALWNALYQWYGSATALPRQVIETEKNLELELYPLTIMLYRHLPTPGKPNGVTGNSNANLAGSSNTPWTGGMSGMYNVPTLNSTMSYVQNQTFNTPKRVLSFTASFSRQATLGFVFTFICQKLRLNPKDTRLDLLTTDDLSFAVVLEEENQTLNQLGVTDLSKILIEVRNKDQTWPEEMGSITNDHLRLNRAMSTLTLEKGLTGLNNLGNTCYLNSAIQCVSNTRPLTLYFTKKLHMFELNRTNPMGMRGNIARRYGDLVTDIWSGTAKTIAPIKLKFTVGKYEPRFATFSQNDAQEFLGFLLDGLHEDLNRVTERLYIELKDSDNRPDVICAQEAWENHLLRNKSIVVDLFHGQLKSSVQCKECHHESVRFDPFTYLTLPLPMESYIFCDFIVVRQNGTVPVRYGLLASLDELMSDIKSRLIDLMAAEKSFKIGVESIMLVQIQNHRISRVFKDSDKITGVFNNFHRVHAFQTSDAEEECQTLAGRCSADRQIQRLLTSTKNQQTAHQNQLLRPSKQPAAMTSSAENGFESSPCHSRQSSLSSYNSSSSGPSSTINFGSSPLENVILVVNRKMIRQESYFIAPQKSRPVLFGLPLIIPFIEGMTHLDLYKRVWSLVSRLVTPLPPSEGPNIYNHALDCDDSLGYEYPFVLRIVSKDAESCCGRCPWFSFCRGCPLTCSENQILEKMSSFTTAVAIDWDPTALHLRYQSTQEFDYIEHRSVQEALRKQSESVALTSCLDTFTKKEELGEDEKVYCARCKVHQLAIKQLQIWRLPPILVINLKRFQEMNGRWIKSHKVVQFPFHDLDPSKYLADIPRRTSQAATSQAAGEPGANGEGDEALFPLQDFHQHRLLPETDAFSLRYRLFAIVCHSGHMAEGHYISYARNPEGKWHCYNDSSCKEVLEDQIDTKTAYMLMYERAGLDCNAYLPRIDPRAVPVMSEEEIQAEENELKKLCSVMDYNIEYESESDCDSGSENPSDNDSSGETTLKRKASFRAQNLTKIPCLDEYTCKEPFSLFPILNGCKIFLGRFFRPFS